MFPKSLIGVFYLCHKSIMFTYMFITLDTQNIVDHSITSIHIINFKLPLYIAKMFPKFTTLDNQSKTQHIVVVNLSLLF